MGNNQEVDISQVLNETDANKQKEIYNAYVKQVTPKHNCCKNVFRAFLIGGLICIVGQALQNMYLSFGLEEKDAALYTSVTLIGISAIMTGFNWYAKLAKFAGAGTIVPITGFANSIVSAAIDYKAQGQVFGIGCYIFCIAGPVILYGIFSSWVLGGIYWLLQLRG